MHNRFDQLGKRVGQSALKTSGPTVAHDEITPDAQHADLRHEPDPARAAERARLGLLGRIASVPCLIEIYGHAPNAEEFRACLSKHLAFWQRRARGSRRNRPPGASIAPFLWIVAAGTPASLLRKLALVPAPGWPPGVYLFGSDVLRVGLIAAGKLRRDRSTLLVRLMAAGPLLARAIEDLAALPRRAHERTVADQILLDLQNALARKPSLSPKEEEFIVTMYKTWDDARDEGRREGREQARLEGAVRALLTALRVRDIPVSNAARKRIQAEKDAARIERWYERAIAATTLADVFDDPS